jgi:hypothetical protein
VCGKKSSGDRSDVSLLVERGLAGHRSFAGPQDDNGGEDGGFDGARYLAAGLTKSEKMDPPLPTTAGQAQPTVGDDGGG